MSDQPRDLTLERVNRLTIAVADLSDSHTSQARALIWTLDKIADRLDRMQMDLAGLTVAMRELASEQILLGNRVENAFSRALRTNIRLDEIEDTRP